MKITFCCREFNVFYMIFKNYFKISNDLLWMIDKGTHFIIKYCPFCGQEISVFLNNKENEGEN